MSLVLRRTIGYFSSQAVFCSGVFKDSEMWVFPKTPVYQVTPTIGKKQTLKYILQIRHCRAWTVEKDRNDTTTAKLS